MTDYKKALEEMSLTDWLVHKGLVSKKKKGDGYELTEAGVKWLTFEGHEATEEER